MGKVLAALAFVCVNTEGEHSQASIIRTPDRFFFSRKMEAFGAIEAEVLEPAALREATRRVPALRGALVERLRREITSDGAPAAALGAAIGVALEGTRAAQAARHAARLVGAGDEQAVGRLDKAVCACRPPPQTCLALLGALLALSNEQHANVADPCNAFPGEPLAHGSADAGSKTTKAGWGSLANSRIDLVSHLTSMIGQSLSAAAAASDPMSPRVMEQWQLARAAALPGWLTSGSPAAAAARVRLASLLSSTGLSGAELARLWPLASDPHSPPAAATPGAACEATPGAAAGRSTLGSLPGDPFPSAPSSSLPASLCHEVLARSRRARTGHAACPLHASSASVCAGDAPHAAWSNAPLSSSRATSLEGLTRHLATDPAVCLCCAAEALLEIASPHQLASAAGWMVRASQLPLPSLRPACSSSIVPQLHTATSQRQPPSNEAYPHVLPRQPRHTGPGWPEAAAEVAFYTAACDGARLELLLMQAAKVHADSAPWREDVARASAQGLVTLLSAADGGQGARHEGWWGVARGPGWASVERAAGDASGAVRVRGHALIEDQEAPEAWHLGAMAVRSALRGARSTGSLASLLAVLRAEAARGTKAVLRTCEDLLIHSICASAREASTGAADTASLLAQREEHIQAEAGEQSSTYKRGESPAEGKDLHAEADARAMADVLPSLRLVRALAAALACLLSEPSDGGDRSGGGSVSFVDTLPRRTSRLRLLGALLPAGREAELLDTALRRAMSDTGARMPPTHAFHGAHAGSNGIHSALDAASWLATRLHTPFEYSHWLLRWLQAGQSPGASVGCAEDAALCLLRAAADRARSGWEAPHVVLQQCAAAAAAYSGGASPASPALQAQGVALLAAALACGVKPRRSVRSVLGGFNDPGTPLALPPPAPPLVVWLEGGCGCARLDWLLTLQAGGESMLKQRLQDLFLTGSGVQRWEHFVSRGMITEMHLLLASADGAAARTHVRQRLALLVGRLSRWRLPGRNTLRALLAPPLPVHGDGDALLSPLQLEAAVASYLEGEPTRGAADGNLLPAACGPLVLPNVAALAVSLVRMAALGGSSSERQAGADAVLLFHAWLPTASLVQEARKILAQDRNGAAQARGRGRRSRGGESVRALQLLERLPPRPADCSPVDWSSLFDEALVLRLHLPGEESTWPSRASEPGTTPAAERDCDATGELPLPHAILDWAAVSLASLGDCPWLRWRLRWLMQRPATSAVALEAQRCWQHLWVRSGQAEADADWPAGTLDLLATAGLNGALVQRDAYSTPDPKGDIDSKAAPQAAVMKQVDHDESSACPPLAAFVGWELCARTSGLHQHELGPALLCTLARDYLPSAPTADDRAELAEKVFCLTVDRLFFEPVASSQAAMAQLMHACAELTSEDPMLGEGRVADVESSSTAEETGAPMSCWLLRALSSVSDALVGPHTPATPEMNADGRESDAHSRPTHDDAAIAAGVGAPARLTDALVCCLRALPPQLLALTPQALAPASVIQAADAAAEVLRRPALLGASSLAELLLCTARRMRPATMSVQWAAAGPSAVGLNDTGSAEVGLHALAQVVAETLDAQERAALHSALDACEARCVKPRLVATPWLAPQADRLLSTLRAACVAEAGAFGPEAIWRRACADSPQLKPTTQAIGSPAASLVQGTLPSTWPKRKTEHVSALLGPQSKVRRAGDTATASPLRIATLD
jgi:hypothetical protein